MRVELRDEARDDLVAGAEFYGRQSPGLEHYYLECLREDLRHLEVRLEFTSCTVGFTENYPDVSPLRFTTS